MAEGTALALLVMLDLVAVVAAGLLGTKLPRQDPFTGLVLGFLVELPRLGIAYLITSVSGPLESASAVFLVNLRLGKYVPIVIMVAAGSAGLPRTQRAKKPGREPRRLRVVFSPEADEATRTATIKKLRQMGAGIDVLESGTLRLHFPRAPESRRAVQAYLDSEKQRGVLQREPPAAA